MQAVNERIQLHLGELLAHPFLAEMKPHPELSRAMAFAEVLAPWVLTFQDLIRINATRARDPEVRKLLAQHAKEDRGHEAWFLEDLDVIFGPRVRDLRWLYSPELDVPREESLAIASEVFHVEDDRLRLVVVEVLEAAAGAFFERVSRQASESGHGGALKYFGGTHLDAEASHEMFEEEERVEEVLPDPVRAEAFSLVARIFGSFERMADAAYAKVREADAAA